MLRFEWLKGSEDDLKRCFALRRSVFVEEQGFQREFDETDKIAWHGFTNRMGSGMLGGFV